MNNKHIGSTLNEFLKEQSIFEEVKEEAMKRVAGWEKSVSQVPGNKPL